jgi:hypothetical protein
MRGVYPLGEAVGLPSLERARAAMWQACFDEVRAKMEARLVAQRSPWTALPLFRHLPVEGVCIPVDTDVGREVLSFLCHGGHHVASYILNHVMQSSVPHDLLKSESLLRFYSHLLTSQWPAAVTFFMTKESLTALLQSEEFWSQCMENADYVENIYRAVCSSEFKFINHWSPSCANAIALSNWTSFCNVALQPVAGEESTTFEERRVNALRGVWRFAVKTPRPLMCTLFAYYHTLNERMDLESLLGFTDFPRSPRSISFMQSVTASLQPLCTSFPASMLVHKGECIEHREVLRSVTQRFAAFRLELDSEQIRNT